MALRTLRRYLSKWRTHSRTCVFENTIRLFVFVKYNITFNFYYSIKPRPERYPFCSSVETVLLLDTDSTSAKAFKRRFKIYKVVKRIGKSVKCLQLVIIRKYDIRTEAYTYLDSSCENNILSQIICSI